MKHMKNIYNSRGKPGKAKDSILKHLQKPSTPREIYSEIKKKILKIRYKFIITFVYNFLNKINNKYNNINKLNYFNLIYLNKLDISNLNIFNTFLSKNKKKNNLKFYDVFFSFNLLKNMPELFRFYGIKFFFFSNEHLPIHVHIQNSDGDAKFNLEPLELIENHGMKNKDLKIAEGIIEENKEIIESRWKEYFAK